MTRTEATEAELSDRLKRQVGRRGPTDTVVMLWHGYLAGLMEWSVIRPSVHSRLSALLPVMGTQEQQELFADKAVNTVREREIEGFSRVAMKKDFLSLSVRRILLMEWDPVGIKDIVSARDEYDFYAPDICLLLREAQPADKIYRHLCWIAREQLGMTVDEGCTLTVANRLHRLPRD